MHTSNVYLELSSQIAIYRYVENFFQMWMYSLGRALLDTTPRVAALTGSVSVSPTSALQSVLAAMTEPDPQRRASLMNLLDVRFFLLLLFNFGKKILLIYLFSRSYRNIVTHVC